MHLRSPFGLTTLALVPFFTYPPQVRGHGYLSQVAIDGKVYVGNVPNAEPTPSIIRQINDISPVKGASNANLNCGQDAQNADLVADASPGSQLQFWWLDGDGTKWPHNTGPLMTYMASCGSTTCDQYDSANAKWFKIAQAGPQPGNTTWYQQNIMNGHPANVTIPSTLKSGQYLIRHEIIALHLATTLGGAEFYPSCTQVNVSGNQVGVASASQEVTFPGGYSDTDSGIYDPNIFSTPIDYTFPGPPLAAFVSGTTSTSGSSSGTGSSSSLPTSGAQPTPTSQTSTASTAPVMCELRQQQAALAVHKRSLSVMAAWIRSIGSRA